MPENRITCWQGPVLRREPGQRREQQPGQQRQQPGQRREPVQRLLRRGPAQQQEQERQQEPVRLPSCRRRPERKRRSGMPAGWNAS
jgi:hypothetical protein